MKTKNACILLLAALTMTACEYDDSALWEQVNQNTERIAALEAWQAETNTNIAALEAWQAETNTNIQSLQTLLNTTDHITDVTPVTENDVEVGYTISFLNSDPITIYCGDNGTAGSTPKIGVTQEDDGNWYWTLNGELLTDNGKPIQANGDSAPVPQLKTGTSLTVSEDSEGKDIVDDAFYLSLDEGETWTSVSGTDGDSFFSDVKVTDEAVIFTLKNSDGTITSFSVPRYTGIKLTFETPAVHLGYGNTQPVNFTAEGSESFTTDNLFIIAPDGWKAEVTLPTRAATKFILNVTLMMLDNQQGNTTIGRIKVDCKSTNLVMNNVTAGALATAIGNRTNLTSITVTSGTLNETDWAAIVKNNAALLYLDLAGAIYEGTDKDILAYSNNGVSSLPLLTIQLPQGVTGLGEYAFNNCTKLTSITLPDKVASIGNHAFHGCIFLTSITLPAGVTSIEEYTFYGCTSLESITLPEGVTTIGSFAFASCKVLESIDLPDKVTSIENSAFSNCYALTSITLPEGVTSIKRYAFNNCTSLESITLPEGVKSIEEYTFNFCSALKSIDLPAGVTSIGERAFFRCTSLTSIDLPEGLESIEEAAFNYCTKLTTVTLPDKVTSIGGYAFAGCEALESIDLPDGLESIGNNVFAACKALTSIDLPAGVTSIGNYAFHNTALKSIDLPAGVTSIGEFAFNYCNALETVTCLGTTPPTITSENIFANCSKLANIYVPAGSVGTYKAATGWSTYETKIKAIQ